MAARKRAKAGRFHGQIALITGGSAGIGLAIARILAAEGAAVIIAGRDSGKLKRAAAELKRRGARITALPCDVRKESEVSSLFPAIRSRFRRLDILVNNAGIAHAGAGIHKLAFETWRDVMATNLDGLFLVTRAALPLMRRGGVIVNNLSVAARQVFAGTSAYNASKHGALGFTDTLREELRPRGIRVIALLAGATDTAIWDTLWPEASRRKMMKAETVATAVVDALALSSESTVEEITIRPAAGTL